jgi:putative ABC transport system ATP-binding protein
MELLRELHEGGATLLMVTHDLAHARQGTRVVSLFDGKITQDERIR